MFVSVFNPPPHTHTHVLQENEVKPMSAPDQSVNDTRCCQLWVFFSFSHLCIFDVSQHITDSEALMSSALV